MYILLVSKISMLKKEMIPVIIHQKYKVWLVAVIAKINNMNKPISMRIVARIKLSMLVVRMIRKNNLSVFGKWILLTGDIIINIAVINDPKLIDRSNKLILMLSFIRFIRLPLL